MMKPLTFALIILTTSIFAKNANAQTLSYYNSRPNTDSLQVLRSITAYNLSSEKELYLLLSPASSLQYLLSTLAPKMKSEELTENGNYTFDFFINGKMAYTENLHPGAILKQDKTTKRPLDIVLFSTKRSGLWSINLWDRFLSSVRLDHFGEKPHLLEIKIRVYINNNGIHYSPVLTTSTLKITNIPNPIDPKTMVPQPIAPESGFKISKAPLNKDLITALNTKIAAKTYKMINAIIVLKKGELLIEQYYNGENRETLHDPRSVSKSMTSTLMGMAIKDGYIKSENQYLKDFYDLKSYQNYSAKKDSVKLIDLLTMSSAFEGNDDFESSTGNEENMYATPDYTKFALDLPMEKGTENGKRWSYFTAGTNLLMDIIEQKTPSGAETYAKKRLFEPLGVQTYQWARTPQEKPFGGGGLRMRALDFAKYGQLYANGGRFNGKRLLNRYWVNKSFSQLQVLPPDRPGFYGMLFWNKTFNIAGKNYQAYYSSGNGGNKIYIFMHLNTVIVVNASAYSKAFAHAQTDQIVQKYLLPAIL